MFENTVDVTNSAESSDASAAPHLAQRKLHEGLRQLLDGNGSYNFLLLRETPLDQRSINGGDIDLLGTRDSVNAFIRHAFELAERGYFHFRVVARKPEKVELKLFSIDCNHVVEFDLWIELWQINRGEHRICFSDCQSLIIDRTAAVSRLPVHLEACLYIHHLVAKHKNLDSDNVKSRLRFYESCCERKAFDELMLLLRNIQRHREITDEMLESSTSILEDGLGKTFESRTPSSVVSSFCAKLRGLLLGSPRHPRAIAFMGCDGVGKTALASHLQSSAPAATRVFRGKHLYRKSLLYKSLVAVVRPLMRTPRETFDEQLALFTYLRAAIALRFLLLRKTLLRLSKLTIIDRTLADFLYVDRKTDEPRFCRGYKVSKIAGRRIPVVHLVVDHTTLCERKQEFTRTGHDIYDKDMLEFHSQRIPTDYTVFQNSQSLDDSSAAMNHLLTTIQSNKKAA